MRPEQQHEEPAVDGTRERIHAARDRRSRRKLPDWATYRPAPGHGRKRILVAPARRFHELAQTLFREPHDAVSGEVVFIAGEGSEGQLIESLRREAPDEVYFDLDGGLDEAVLTRAGARLLMDGVAVHLVVPQLGLPAVRASISRMGGQAVLSLAPTSEGGAAASWRRVLDVVGAALLLVLLAPVFTVVALLVWTRMGRPVIHVQQRVGQRGRLFGLYKFRSMVAGAEAMLHTSPDLYRRYVAAGFKVPVEDDERITSLGRFLRRASLDELPQLWNVLRGDMSLVGPRAIVPDEVAEYGDYARMLLRIKPGLTGLWQVSGRSTVGYPARARMDLEYVQGRSLRRDLQLLLRTLPAVIRQRGAL